MAGGGAIWRERAGKICNEKEKDVVVEGGTQICTLEISTCTPETQVGLTPQTLETRHRFISQRLLRTCALQTQDLTQAHTLIGTPTPDT